MFLPRLYPLKGHQNEPQFSLYRAQRTNVNI